MIQHPDLLWGVSLQEGLYLSHTWDGEQPAWQRNAICYHSLRSSWYRDVFFHTLIGPGNSLLELELTVCRPEGQVVFSALARLCSLWWEIWTPTPAFSNYHLQLFIGKARRVGYGNTELSTCHWIDFYAILNEFQIYNSHKIKAATKYMCVPHSGRDLILPPQFLCSKWSILT